MLNQDYGQNILPHPALLRQGSASHRAPKQKLHTFSPGETIPATGTSPEPIYRVTSGCVAFYQLLSDGRRQITDIIGPGRCFTFAGKSKDGTFAKTLAYTDIETLDAITNPSLAHEVAVSAVARLTHHATMLGRMTAVEKIATALFDLAQQFPRKTRAERSTKTTLMLYLTRADLADWLGLTVETVSRTFSQLKRAGLIAFSHPEIVTISNPAQLAAIADGAKISDITAKQGRKPLHAIS